MARTMEGKADVGNITVSREKVKVLLFFRQRVLFSSWFP